jgi:hypothetical protein
MSEKTNKITNETVEKDKLINKKNKTSPAPNAELNGSLSLNLE